MSETSQWPLSFDAIRFVSPAFMIQKMANSNLSGGCYPLAMGYYPKASGHFMRRREHDDNLLIYCTDGAGQVQTDQFSGPVKRGQVLLLPRGTHHYYSAHPRTPWSIYWFHFAGHCADELIDQLRYRPERPVSDIGLSPQLTADFKRLLALRQMGYHETAFHQAAGQIKQILLGSALGALSQQASQRQDFNLEEIQALMQQNLQGDIDLDTLASSVNLSKFHFINKYKQATGYPPIRHFLLMKMERACYLLDTTELPIKSVGFQLGYRDPLYFSRIFSKIIGLSPSSYKHQQRG